MTTHLPGPNDIWGVHKKCLKYQENPPKKSARKSRQMEHELQTELQRVIGNFEQLRFENAQQTANLLNYYGCFINSLKPFLWHVVEHIHHFTNQQRLAIFSPQTQNYHQILVNVHNCFSKAVQCLSTILEDISRLKFCQNPEPVELNSLTLQVDDVLNFIFANCFVVLDQPLSSNLKNDPLTIFSNAKFETRLAILVEPSLISNISSDFGVRLLSEAEIRQFHAHGPCGLEGQKPSFQISQKATPHKQFMPFLSIHLVNMLTVDMNRRGHKPKALPVSEEKFQFLFGATVQFRNKVYPLTCFSFPVNVLSRKDYRNSYATILWDNAFPMPNRELFETQASVPWARLAELLSNKFLKDVGIPLKPAELEFISSMLPDPKPNCGNDHVAWEQFAKTHLPHRDFTFFEWFYKILILVREQLSELYCSGLIHGFISSSQAQHLLYNTNDGTFLIRFSETIPGAITVAFVRNGQFEKLYPWDIERLKKISLSHTIKCNDFLLFLEPMIPKDTVFSPFYAHSESTHSITGTDYKSDTNIASLMESNTMQ